MAQAWNYTEASEVFGITPQAVAGLVLALGIETRPSRYNGKAKLLNEKGMARIAKAIERPWPPVESAVPA